MSGRISNLVYLPIIEISGRDKPFVHLVEVELVYSNNDVDDLAEEFLPLGKKLPFSRKFGTTLRSHKDRESKCGWERIEGDEKASIERIRMDQVKISLVVKHFCK